ncbi:MAG TPA: FAD binding domain-containing protein [Candidatus Cloacimonadota bacterium]|nr:FAD binding domain-containing protein [Candidatus Cloacimonadota bacterium]
MKRKTDLIKQVKLSFWLNGNFTEIAIPPGMTTLELLNDRLNLSGTKCSCNEGDCGACTVVIAQKQKGKVIYRAINSCLYLAARLQDKHLITIEGLAEEGNLHPIQTAILDAHATQCGFCTPGFVMSIFALLLNHSNPSENEVLAALEGNLCRCTGYDSILKAIEILRKKQLTAREILPARLKSVEKKLQEELQALITSPSENVEGHETLNYYAPHSLEELWELLQNKKTDKIKFLAGGTDLQVQANIQNQHPEEIISLSEINELQGIKLADKYLRIGAAVTLSEIRQNKSVQRYFPLLITTIEQMASEQIRNVATLAGNIANASPVADGATALLALEAVLELASAKGIRKIKLSIFYHAYKQTALQEGEIILSVLLPLPSENNNLFGFWKSAKRKSLDISSVVTAVQIQMQGAKINKAVISVGGVAPYPALAVKTMAFLKGKIASFELINKAAEKAQQEFTPISDLRGSEQYRRLLIKNHLLKLLSEILPKSEVSERGKA